MPRKKQISPRRTLVVLEEEAQEIPSVEIVLGTRKVQVYPMTVGSFQRAVHLFEPYLQDIARTVIGTVGVDRLRDSNSLRQGLAEAIGEKLSAMAVQVPETVVQLFACIMNVDPERDKDVMGWLLETVTPSELVGMFPKLDELNDFEKMLSDVMGLFDYLDDKYKLTDAFRKASSQAEEERQAPVLEER